MSQNQENQSLETGIVINGVFLKFVKIHVMIGFDVLNVDWNWNKFFSDAGYDKRIKTFADRNENFSKVYDATDSDDQIKEKIINSVTKNLFRIYFGSICGTYIKTEEPVLIDNISVCCYNSMIPEIRFAKIRDETIEKDVKVLVEKIGFDEEYFDEIKSFIAVNGFDNIEYIDGYICEDYPSIPPEPLQTGFSFGE